MRIAVTGTEGQVVRSLMERGLEAGFEIIPLGRPQCDLAEPASLEAAIAAAKPDIVVSAAAYTAVDKAESEPDLAHSINGLGAGAVSAAAAKVGVPVIHLSTDYVFDGAKIGAYTETDATGPVSVYGASKLEGERLVAAANPAHVILRTAWVYSPFGNNFVKTMLRLAETRDKLGVVSDQTGCPTSALDIADAIFEISRRLQTSTDPSLYGIFHLSGSGVATWADLAELIFEALAANGGKAVHVDHIATADYKTAATRPANSRLSGDKLSAVYGLTLPDWKVSAKAVVERLLEETQRGNA